MSSANAKRGKSSVADAASEDLQSAKKSALEAYEHLLDAKEKFKAAAMQAGLDAKEVTSERLEASAENVQVRAIDAVAESQSYIIDKPLTSVGIAFLSGYLLAKLSK